MSSTIHAVRSSVETCLASLDNLKRDMRSLSRSTRSRSHRWRYVKLKSASEKLWMVLNLLDQAEPQPAWERNLDRSYRHLNEAVQTLAGTLRALRGRAAEDPDVNALWNAADDLYNIILHARR